MIQIKLDFKLKSIIFEAHSEGDISPSLAVRLLTQAALILSQENGVSPHVIAEEMETFAREPIKPVVSDGAAN